MVSCNNNTEFINSFRHPFESTGMLLERSDLKITGDLEQGMYNYSMFYIIDLVDYLYDVDEAVVSVIASKCSMIV